MTLRTLVLFLLVPALAACQRDDAPATPSAADTAPPMTAPATTTDDDRARSEPEIPTLKLTTLDGSEYDLAARRGQWVVVNYWATWCAPCLKEMPELSALDAMREHIDVVGLAYEDIDPEAMRAFLQKRPVVYPIAILDTYAPPADFATPRGLPMTWLIAPDGRVARKFLGPVTAVEIEAAIEAAGGPEAPRA